MSSAELAAGRPGDYEVAHGSIVFRPGEVRHEVTVPLVDSKAYDKVHECGVPRATVCRNRTGVHMQRALQ